jgi:hypothetical protein
MLIYRGITISTEQQVMGYLTGENIIKPIGRNVTVKVKPETLEVSLSGLLDAGENLWFSWFGAEPMEAILEDVFKALDEAGPEDVEKPFDEEKLFEGDELPEIDSEPAQNSLSKDAEDN